MIEVLTIAIFTAGVVVALIFSGYAAWIGVDQVFARAKMKTGTDAIWVSSPREAVEALYRHLEPSESLLEIGSGDGAVLLEVVRRGIVKRGYGIERRRWLCFLSRIRAALCGVSNRITIIHGDALNIVWPEANAIYLYLFPTMMDKIEDRIRVLRPGVTIYSLQFPVPYLVQGNVWESGGKKIFMYRISDEVRRI